MMNILVNADDFGISDDVNRAIDFCFLNNYIDRASLMVNMPGVKNAIELAKKNNYMDKINLHLNLIEGEPLTDEIKDTAFCVDGKFNSLFLKNTKNRLFINKTTGNAVEKEMHAQIQAFKDYGFDVIRLDSHEHSHTSWSILKILLRNWDKYGISELRLSRNIPSNEMVGLKGIYKKICNKFIIKKNSKGCVAPMNLITLFGSQDDIEKELRVKHYGLHNAELMIHPTMTNEKLKDVFNACNIEQWITHNKCMFTRLLG